MATEAKQHKIGRWTWEATLTKSQADTRSTSQKMIDLIDEQIKCIDTGIPIPSGKYKKDYERDSDGKPVLDPTTKKMVEKKVAKHKREWFEEETGLLDVKLGTKTYGRMNLGPGKKNEAKAILNEMKKDLLANKPISSPQVGNWVEQYEKDAKESLKNLKKR